MQAFLNSVDSQLLTPGQVLRSPKGFKLKHRKIYGKCKMNKIMFSRISILQFLITKFNMYYLNFCCTEKQL